LLTRGWTKISVGQQQAGDVGSTCGEVPHHGTDHIYLVLRTLNVDEMVVADNQEPTPHFRFASGNGKSPTTYFLRPLGTSLTAARFMESGAAEVDDDPAAPAEGEVSETAGFEAARFLVNLGAPAQAEEPLAGATALAAGLTASFDVSHAKAFLQACETSVPRVTYGLGKKVPSLNAVPGRDFTQVDCSGFIREAIRLATSPPVPFPDGSVVQHDWIRARGFKLSTIAEGKNDDGVVRIAFLRPQDSAQRIGHVVLISGGMTIESHGGVGPDSRVWNGASWQAKAFVYVLAQNGRLALPESAATSFRAAPAVVADFAVPTAEAVFTVHHGRRYAATIVLSGIFEPLASNDQVADRLRQVGFTDVVVTGSGPTRHAEATWSGSDMTGPVDPHLRDVVDVSTAHSIATPDAPAAALAVFRPNSRHGTIRKSANIFSAASLPEHHEKLLAVRMRPQAMTAQRPPMALGGAATEVSFEPQTVGLSALSFYDRHRKVKRVVPLRARRAEGPSPRTPAAAALAFSAVSAPPTDAAANISFIELEREQDVDELHQEMTKDPNVVSVSRVAARYLEMQNTVQGGRIGFAAAPPSQQLWNLSKILWQEAHGLGSFRDANDVRVAILDTGVDQGHPNLRVDEYHWQNPDLTVPVSDQDLVGHGTHVSGIISALLSNSIAVKGICECRLIVHKIFSDADTYAPALGYFTYFVDPILYRRALAACVENPVDVMNLSIGGPAVPDPVEQSLFDQLIASGTTICAAMGNERQAGNPTSYPAAIAGVVAVGATTLDDSVADFSNGGNHIAVSAPGKAICSTLPRYIGQTGFAAVFGPDGTPGRGRPISREVNFDAWDGRRIQVVVATP
jgi:hypothetical protein